MARTETTFAASVRARLTRLGELWPWTPLGMLVALGAAGALRFLAFEQLDLVLLVVGYAGVGLWALGSLLVMLGALGLGLRRKPALAPLQAAETAAPLSTAFSWPALRWVPLLQVEADWVSPAATVESELRGGRLHEQVRFVHRGRVRGVVRRVTVQDAFGLCRIRVRKADPARAFDVMPHVGALRSVPILASLSGGDDVPHPHGLDAGDRIELARYMPGDPARLIHWKIYGRTGKLMVRKPERALSPSRRAAAFLVVGEHDEASAACARVAIEQRALGNDWVFGADVDATGTSDARAAIEIIVRSPEALSTAGQAAAQFYDQASKQGPVHAIAFVPPNPGPWLASLEHVARRRRLHVVIGTDGLAEVATVPLWRRVLLRQAPAPSVDAAALQAVVAAFSRLGCSVNVIDRKGGRLLGAQHVSALSQALGSSTPSVAQPQRGAA